MQNFYNVAHRDDDDLIDSLAAQGIAYVPYFPLGGFSPLQSDTLESVAARSGHPMAVALAWLLQRSPNILLIPGTSSVAHLRENVAGAALDPLRGRSDRAEQHRLTTRPPRKPIVERYPAYAQRSVPDVATKTPELEEVGARSQRCRRARRAFSIP